MPCSSYPRYNGGIKMHTCTLLCNFLCATCWSTADSPQCRCSTLEAFCKVLMPPARGSCTCILLARRRIIQGTQKMPAPPLIATDSTDWRTTACNLRLPYNPGIGKAFVQENLPPHCGRARCFRVRCAGRDTSSSYVTLHSPKSRLSSEAGKWTSSVSIYPRSFRCFSFGRFFTQRELKGSVHLVGAMSAVAANVKDSRCANSGPAICSNPPV